MRNMYYMSMESAWNELIYEISYNSYSTIGDKIINWLYHKKKKSRGKRCTEFGFIIIGKSYFKMQSGY